MAKSCLNCSTLIPDTRDFCLSCEERLDDVVDHRELDGQDMVEKTGSYNPFFTSSSVTGRIRSEKEDTVSKLLEKNEDDSNLYWWTLATILFLMALMLRYFL